MKKTHWPARLAAGCLVTLTLVGVAFAAGQQGSQSDPLVTLSYLTQKATPSILSQVDSQLTARETELKKQLSAVVEGYVKEVEDKLASSGGGSSVQPSGGASYQVVNLSAGQTITGGAAAAAAGSVSTSYSNSVVNGVVANSRIPFTNAAGQTVMLPNHFSNMQAAAQAFTKRGCDESLSKISSQWLAWMEDGQLWITETDR